ncbi:isocitrate/isopropylmalate dehydrogenase family protein [Ancylobacter sp. Lp-2]|uniref:isocitrate/isopropylmalate family dehydrogenase n=1 Tax=Ancylobacter sp. Lp-2 TaxID=2881339 RepID=UPI001E5A56FF|nr:isocitrate/isopropylmalate family dehydrogenase [Ancylobacter sp. Lp-2]MCB4770140.1 isocitrate/isopropylmalate dehydrogenase family protein [Ancylobacter sp. Lp-2]
MSSLKIAVLPGDHIGPEITAAAVLALQAADRRFALGLAFEEHVIGHASLAAHGTSLTDDVYAAAVAADAILLGPCDNGGYPSSAGGINVPGRFRHDLDLYANLRPSKSSPSVPNARAGLDVLVVRENSEGFYPDRNMFEGYGEMMPVEGVAISMRKITAHASKRIAHSAFQWARRRRGHVTVLSKKHIFKMTDGLFYDECMKVAAEYPDVRCDSVIVDAFNADIYMRPERYDVVVMTNLIGDIISNLCSALAGSLGLGGGLNAGADHVMANASHGSAPDIAGEDKANPISMVISAGMMLGWLGARHGRDDLLLAEKAITTAIDQSLGSAATRTVDVGGTASCRTAAATIAEAIAQYRD